MRFALLALVACGGAPLPTTQSFTLLEPGAEPRSVVRYETEPGTARNAFTYKQRTTTKYENTVMEEGRTDIDLPAIRAISFVTATGVSPAGDADLNIVVADAHVLDDVVDPRMRTVARRAAREMHGKRSQLTRASSGQLMNVEAPDGLEDVIRASALVFPHEPIGIGARWSRTTSIEVNKVRWYETTTFTLRDRTSDSVTIDVASEFRAGDQALHAEPNATTRLTGGTGRGSGHFVIPLRGLAVRGKADETRTMKVLITRGHTRIAAEITSELFLSYDAAQ